MRLSFKSKNQMVHEALLDAIVRGEFPPDERIIIDELAQRMQVSPIPIREALRELEADGFVSFAPHIGFTVTPIHAELMIEVFALLESMEVFSSRRACETLTDDDIATLETMIRAMDQSVSDPARWSQENKALHSLICDIAGAALIKRMLQKALNHWERLMRYYFKDVFSRRVQIAQQEHWQLLDAFKKRDADSAELIIRTHNQTALAGYLKQVSEIQREEHS